MTEIERITEQLTRAFEGNAWHGPSVTEALKDLTARQASRRPLPAAHSIWELVLHMAVWEKAVRMAVTGQEHKVAAEMDWQAVSDQSELAWNKALEDLRSGHMALRNAIVTLTDAALQRAVKDSTRTVYDLLHGAIHHDLYHAGQIVLLRKALG